MTRHLQKLFIFKTVLIGLVLGVSLFLLSPQQVSAQSTDSLETLQATYQKQLATYRTDEKAYTLAQQQNLQLGTLASLEEAVKATRQVMITRTELFITYFSMAKITLSNTKGIEVNEKTNEIAAIDKLLETLKQHDQQVQKATDKPGLVQVQADFATLVPELNNRAYRALTLITYGNIQSLYDKTIVVTQEMATYTDKNEKNALNLAEKKRGFQEISRTLTQTGTDLTKARAEMTQRQQLYSSSVYGSFVDQMQKVYGGVSQSVEYLRELMK